MSEHYPLYSGEPESATGPWHVLVEYANPRGQGKPPTMLTYPVRHLASREEAQAQAEQTAYDFEPPDPWTPKRRQVYRDGDGYLTVIEGASSIFHFSTRVVQFIAEA